MQVIKSTLNNPVNTIVEIKEKNSVAKFLEELLDSALEFMTGKKYFHELERIQQETLTFFVAGSKEVAMPPRDQITHSGVYCITDVNGKTQGFGMAKVRDRFIAYRYEAESYEDLKYLDSETIASLKRKVLHSWTTDENVLIRSALDAVIPAHYFIDRFSLPIERAAEEKMTKDAELAHFLKAEVGADAFTQAKLGTRESNTQNVYFISPGIYHVFKFMEMPTGLKVVSCPDGIATGPIVSLGDVAGLTLDDLPKILSHRS